MMPPETATAPSSIGGPSIVSTDRARMIMLQQWLALRLHNYARGRHEQVADLLADQWQRLFAAAGLIMLRIKFLGRQQGRRTGAIRIPLPQNRSQAPAVGSAEIRDQIVRLFVGNFRRRTIHSGLSRQGVAKSRRGERAMPPRLVSSSACRVAEVLVIAC